MSEANRPREWGFYVEDMIAFCDKVVAYNTGVDRAGFAAEPMRYDATLRNLELIGRLRRTYRRRCATRHPMCRGD